MSIFLGIGNGIRYFVTMNLSVFLLLSFGSAVYACPKYKDETFYEQRQIVELSQEYDTYWSEIDTSNGICLMQKFAEKGSLILRGLVHRDKCEGVYFLRLALLENVKVNFGTVLFDPSERWALTFLNGYYNDAYFSISAIEGDGYARFKMAKKMYQNLDNGYADILGVKTPEYINTMFDYLADSSKNSYLKSYAEELKIEIGRKFGEISEFPLVNTKPIQVICPPQ